jgi:hypothetical protein
MTLDLERVKNTLSKDPIISDGYVVEVIDWEVEAGSTFSLGNESQLTTVVQRTVEVRWWC